jgi:hypothetical protein
LAVLKQYDSEYLAMLKQSKVEGRSLLILQLERAQRLKGVGLQAEREALRNAVMVVTKESEQVTLGIMADSGTIAIRTLKAWVTALDLPRGKLRAVEEGSTEDLELRYVFFSLI